MRSLGREDLLEKGQATHSSILGLPWWLSWYRIHLQCRRPGFDPWVGKIPWRRGWLPTPVFWPGESHGLYSPWDCKELDRTEQLSLSRNLHTVLHSGYATLHSHQSVGGSFLSTPSPSFMVCRLDDDHFDWCEAMAHYSFDLHF